MGLFYQGILEHQSLYYLVVTRVWRCFIGLKDVPVELHDEFGNRLYFRKRKSYWMLLSNGYKNFLRILREVGAIVGLLAFR